MTRVVYTPHFRLPDLGAKDLDSRQGRKKKAIWIPFPRASPRLASRAAAREAAEAEIGLKEVTTDPYHNWKSIRAQSASSPTPL